MAQCGSECTPTPSTTHITPTWEPLYKTPTPRPTRSSTCLPTGQVIEGWGQETPSARWMLTCGNCIMSGAPTPTLEPYVIVGTCLQWGSPYGCVDRIVGNLQECLCDGTVPNPVLYGTPTSGPVVLTSTPTTTPQPATPTPQLVHFWLSPQYIYDVTGGSSNGYADTYDTNQVYMCSGGQPAAYLVDLQVTYSWVTDNMGVQPGVNPYLTEDGSSFENGWMRARTGPYIQRYCLGPTNDLFQLDGVNYHPCEFVNNANYPLKVGLIGQYAPNPGRFDGLRGQWFYSMGNLTLNIRAVCIGKDEPIPTPTPTLESLYCGSVESEEEGGSINDVGDLPEILIGPADCSFQFGGISIPMDWANSLAQFAGIEYTFPSKIGLDGLQICAAPLKIGRLEVLGVGIELDQFLLVVSALAIMFMVLRS